MSLLKDADANALIREILTRAVHGTDTRDLEQYRRFILKKVPFGRRVTVAAYLFKQLYEAAPDEKQAKKKARPEKKKLDAKKPERSQGAIKTSDAARGTEGGKRVPVEKLNTTEPKRNLDEADSVKLFLSAGRNRRAYPREIIALLTSGGAISKDDIGEIRILDNFSFIQVRRSQVDKIISAVEGKLFRGRPVSIGLAKPKKGEDDAALPSNDVAGGREQEDEKAKPLPIDDFDASLDSDTDI